MTRILTAIVLIPLVVAVVLAAPLWAFLLFAIAVGVVAYFEFDAIAAAHGLPKTGWPGMAFGAVWLVSTERTALAVLMLAVLTLIVLAAFRTKDLSRVLGGSACGVLGILYIFGAWRCAVGVREINPHWLVIALLVSWVGDTAAYYVGRRWGREKLAPRISPAKTREGAIASVIAGTIAAAVYAYFFISVAPLWAVLLTGAFANVAGQVGDLAESAFKRGANIKDSGKLLPGHGGFLDRIDSCLFSIPAVYMVFRLVLEII
jgi:phosphatidate cytidylyltransferase